MADENVLPWVLEGVDSDGALAETALAVATTRRGLFGLAAGGAALGVLGNATGAGATSSRTSYTAAIALAGVSPRPICGWWSALRAST